MVRILTALTAAINDASAPALTRAECWSALMMKARRPQDFIEVITDCEVVSEDEKGLTRIMSATARGPLPAGKIKEEIKYFEPFRMEFYQPATGVTVNNIVSEDTTGKDLFLTFSSEQDIPSIGKGSKEEMEKNAMQKKMMSGALMLSIKNMRDLKAAGKL